MENKEWTFKTPGQYVPGPWDSEPDKAQWMGKAGLPCLIVRGPLGALCGYVGVSKGHPHYGESYDVVHIKAHWGLTFSGKCQHHEHGICHVVAEGEDDDVWWLGFDCAHFGDATPPRADFPERLPFEHETYKDFEYVKAETERLAERLAEQVR